MRRLTLRERDSLFIGTNDGLSEAEAAAFARLQPSLPAGSLTWGHRSIRFGPFCGVLRAGLVTIELLPKIGAELDQSESARGMLLAMLRKTRNLAVTGVGEAALGQQRAHLLDQFILDFCARVSVALRGGAIARYEGHEDNLNALRGRLVLTNHLRRNATDRSYLFCSFDERTVDNKYNRALKAVLSVLRASAISPQTKMTVAALLHRFDEVASCSVTPRDIAKLVFDRMTESWEPIFQQARWLLQGLFPDVRHGEIDGVCLLFNMERLFEAFIGVKIRAAWCGNANGSRSYKTVMQGPQRSFARSDAGEVFKLRPDVSILDQGDVIRIFDAKWKRLNPKTATADIEPADVYQLAAYASRYQCKRVALVYPASIGCPHGLIKEYEVATSNAPCLEIYTVDVRSLCFGGTLPTKMRPPHQGQEIFSSLQLSGARRSSPNA